jgi:hypothetical protein
MAAIAGSNDAAIPAKGFLGMYVVNHPPMFFFPASSHILRKGN